MPSIYHKNHIKLNHKLRTMMAQNYAISPRQFQVISHISTSYKLLLVFPYFLTSIPFHELYSSVVSEVTLLLLFSSSTYLLFSNWNSSILYTTQFYFSASFSSIDTIFAIDLFTGSRLTNMLLIFQPTISFSNAMRFEKKLVQISVIIFA